MGNYLVLSPNCHGHRRSPGGFQYGVGERHELRRGAEGIRGVLRRYAAGVVRRVVLLQARSRKRRRAHETQTRRRMPRGSIQELVLNLRIVRLANAPPPEPLYSPRSLRVGNPTPPRRERRPIVGRVALPRFFIPLLTI